MGIGLFHALYFSRQRRLITTILLFGLGCGTDGSAGLGPSEALLSDDLDEGRGRVVLVRDASARGLPSDPITIGEVSFDGDTIQIEVSFGGGCAEHRLQLVAETTWMESWPVQVFARVTHDANDDPCDAVLQGTLRFDLSPLKRMYQQAYQTPTGKIALQIAGATGVPVYEF